MLIKGLKQPKVYVSGWVFMHYAVSLPHNKALYCLCVRVCVCVYTRGTDQILTLTELCAQSRVPKDIPVTEKCLDTHSIRGPRGQVP